MNQYIFRLGTDLLSLLILLLSSSCSCWSNLFQKGLRFRGFKSDPDEILQDCPSSEHASIDRVRFWIRRHTFKMMAVTSFHKKA